MAEPKRVGVDRTRTAWVVVKDGQYVAEHDWPFEGCLFARSLDDAVLFDRLSIAREDADALGGTVVPVTVTLAHKDAPLDLVE